MSETANDNSKKSDGDSAGKANVRQKNSPLLDETAGPGPTKRKKRELKTNAGVPKYPNRTTRTQNKGRSRVWDYYNDITPDATQYCSKYQAQCLYCNYVMKGEPLRMRNHLIKKCSKCPPDVKQIMEEDNQLCFMKKRKKEQHLILGPSTPTVISNTDPTTGTSTAAESSASPSSTQNLSLNIDDNVPEWARVMVNTITDNVNSQLSSLKESISLQLASHKAQVHAQLINTNARLTNLETSNLM